MKSIREVHNDLTETKINQDGIPDLLDAMIEMTEHIAIIATALREITNAQPLATASLSTATARLLAKI